jgi:hypothetical protein
MRLTNGAIAAVGNKSGSPMPLWPPFVGGLNYLILADG